MFRFTRMIAALALCAAALPAFATQYARTLVVDEAGTEGFVDPAVAVNSISDAGPESRYLVKVMPGHYVLPAGTTLVGKPYVDLEGSGEGVTVIETVGVKVFELAANEEVRSLTFKESTSAALGSGGWNCMVDVLGAGRMRNVTIDGNDRKSKTFPLCVRASANFDFVTAKAELPETWASNAAYVLAGPATFTHCSLRANGYGLVVGWANTDGQTVTVVDSAIRGGFQGVQADGCLTGCTEHRTVIRDSTITTNSGGHWAVVASANAKAVVYVSNTILDVGAVQSNVTSGVKKCVGVYTPTLDPVTCN